MERFPGEHDSNEELPLVPSPKVQDGFLSDSNSSRQQRWMARLRNTILPSSFLTILVLLGIIIVGLFVVRISPWRSYPHSLPVERAIERTLDLGGEISLWYRVWGNLEQGIPVLFVHGGPGNCIDDYHNRTKRFFDYNVFYVVEVDQRGTGRSQPSVREDCQNLRYYKDLTIDQMSLDFEQVRQALNIDRWLVFGGSWGSTLSLDYAERFPHRLLGVILQGIWLCNRVQYDAVFTQRANQDNPKHLDDFKNWLKPAEEEARNSGEGDLDPNDSERFMHLYQRLIERCDMNAIWHWFVWMSNLQEEDPSNRLDLSRVDSGLIREATSLAFFQNHLSLQGVFERPTGLLERVKNLNGTNVWVCQGLRDEICPAMVGAVPLVDTLVGNKVPVRATFVDGGHYSSDPEIERCYKEAVQDFLQHMK